MRLWVDVQPKPGLIGPALRLELIEQLTGRPPLEAPIVLKLRFIFKRPTGELRPVPADGAALPGLVRAVLDELAGVAYRDEQQLAAMHVSKEYGNVNGVELGW